MVVHTIVKNDPDTAKSLPAVRSRGWRTVLLLCGWARRSHPYSQTGRPAAKSHPTCRPTAPVAQAVASRFPGIQTFCSGILHSTNKRRYFQYSVRSTQYAGQVQSALSRRRGEFTRARTRRILQGLHGRAAPEVHPAAVCARVGPAGHEHFATIASQDPIFWLSPTTGTLRWLPRVPRENVLRSIYL